MTADDAIRSYLIALKDPQSLRDEDAIAETTSRLESTNDPLERLELQERLRRLGEPAMDGVEEQFISSARSWADERSISGESFLAEGVPADVLRRAGFEVGRARSSKRRSSRGTSTRRASSGKRVTTEQVIEAMPGDSFTVKQLQDLSGASPAVVRKAIKAEMDAGRLADVGPDPDHSGPGRSPTLYTRSKKKKS